MRLLRTDLRPCSLVHMQGFFVGVALSHVNDCDLFDFLGGVCNGLDFVLGLASGSFIFFAGLTVISSKFAFPCGTTGLNL